MNLPPDKQAKLDDLLQRLSAGPLPAAAAEQLNDLLHGDPAACERYLDHLTLEACLHREFGGEKHASDALPSFARASSVTGGLTSPARQGLRFALTSSVVRFAAALLLGSLLTLAALRSVSTPDADKPPDQAARPYADCVATLLFADNCQWTKHEKFVEGQRLPVTSLRLERGLAVLRFDGGAAVVLEGPTELDIESRGAARLARGQLTVRAPEEAAGFTVRTPASDVIDLGTEFAVKVERNGATEVHVLEGEVAFGKPGTPQESAELLTAGKAVRYDLARQLEPRVVPVNAPRFAELLQQARIGAREDLLVAYENFNYPLGALPLADADGGTGWAGPWRPSPNAKPDQFKDLTIASAKLNVPWPIVGGRGPMLEADPAYQSRTRPLAQPVRLDEDGVYYVSVLVRWDAPPPPPAGQTNPAVRIVLRCEKNFAGDHVMFNLPHSHRPQLDLRTGAVFNSAQTVARGETQLWVGKIVARRHGEDEVFFKVYGANDKLDAIEPADWHVRSNGFASDAQLDILLLTKFGASTCWWDEVRIGKSWRAVVPTLLKK